MAIYHFSAQVIKRSEGRSSVAAAAYRLGVSMYDARTGNIHDYTRKGGVHGWEQLLPENAPSWMADPAECWNSVEAVEKRKDAQLCREINMALPRELNTEQMKNLTRSWVNDNCVSKGLVATVAWHELDSENPHAHVMLSMRPIENETWGKKPQDWNKRKDELEQWRESWAKSANAALADAGHAERIDHRSLKDQGIERQAQIHMGPKATAMERRGETPDRQRYIHPTPNSMSHEVAKQEQAKEQNGESTQDPAKLRRQRLDREIDVWEQYYQHLGGRVVAQQAMVDKYHSHLEELSKPYREAEKMKDDVSDQVKQAKELANMAGEGLARSSRRIEKWRENHPLRDRLGHWARPKQIKVECEKAQQRQAERNKQLENVKRAELRYQEIPEIDSKPILEASMKLRSEQAKLSELKQHLSYHEDQFPEKVEQRRLYQERELERQRREWHEQGNSPQTSQNAHMGHASPDGLASPEQVQMSRRGRFRSR